MKNFDQWMYGSDRQLRTLEFGFLLSESWGVLLLFVLT
jgi:hypothetical protein